MNHAFKRSPTGELEMTCLGRDSMHTWFGSGRYVLGHGGEQMKEEKSVYVQAPCVSVFEYECSFT